MKKDVNVYLNDILGSITRIENYISGQDFKEFCKDLKTQDAVVRNIEVIGEAVNRIPTEFFDNYPDFPSKEAIAMRNFLIHDYSNIELEIVWKTIQTDIPQLRDQIEDIIKNTNE